jgi:hypothetical protein
MSMSLGERGNAASRGTHRRGHLHRRFVLELTLAIAVYHALCGVFVSRGAIVNGKDVLQDCENSIINKPRKKKRLSPRTGTRAGTGTRTPSPTPTPDSASRSSFWDSDWNVTSKHGYLDIGVPLCGQDDKLVEFVASLGSSIRKFRELKGDMAIDFRLLVTRYPDEDTTASFHTKLAEKVSLASDKVIFAPALDTQFHRAVAVNVLHKHTRHDADSILAIIDVDLQVGAHFFVNAMNFVSTGIVYFPIVWSQFRPSNVKLVETVLGPLPEFHEHNGLWRNFGYGIYALSGLDANETLMDESFVGWGGEDNDFYARVQARNMVVVRESEHDLVHVWHSKYCELGSFVSEKRLQTWYAQYND